MATIVMATGSKQIQREKVEDFIFPCFMKSEEFAKDFHEHEEIRRDILLFKDYLIDDGIISLHDVNLESVCKVADECIVNSDEFIVEDRIGYIFFASKQVSKTKLFSSGLPILIR